MEARHAVRTNATMLGPLTTLVCMKFRSGGISEFYSEENRIEPQTSSILEIFTHCDSLTDAYQMYSRLSTAVLPGHPALNSRFTDFLSAVNDEVALLLMRNRVLVCAPAAVPQAYWLARAPTPVLPEDRHIYDLTRVSQQQPFVASLLARHFGLAAGCSPRLSLSEFESRVEELYAAGILTTPVGCVDFGSLKRRVPVCSNFGFSRGAPVDRYYLDCFVTQIRKEVVGITLEIGGSKMGRYSYGFDRVTEYRTLDSDAGAAADINKDAHDPTACEVDSLDSIVIFNVLEHCRYPWVVVENMRRWLRTGGKVFCMVPCMQRVHRRPQDYWRFLPDAFASLFASFTVVRSEVYGNLVAAIASLSGVAAEELSAVDLNTRNPEYPVAMCLVAQKT